jgi:DNA-binding NarL/FixJ family response regulator
MKVIVIDDSEVSLTLTANALKSAGIEVVTLSSPLGGAAAIAQHHPDVVLLDIDMPALSGEKVATILKRQRSFSGVRVLLYSDRPEEALDQAAKRCGADGFIRKTNQTEVLINHIKRAAAAS